MQHFDFKLLLFVALFYAVALVTKRVVLRKQEERWKQALEGALAAGAFDISAMGEKLSPESAWAKIASAEKGLPAAPIPWGLIAIVSVVALASGAVLTYGLGSP